MFEHIGRRKMIGTLRHGVQHRLALWCQANTLDTVKYLPGMISSTSARYHQLPTASIGPPPQR
jgi:hypothetical protein